MTTKWGQVSAKDGVWYYLKDRKSWRLQLFFFQGLNLCVTSILAIQYAHIHSLTQRSRNLTSRFLFAMRQQQAAPMAVWVEARGERSLEVASIPDLQLSLSLLLSHYPMSLCCCSLLSFSGQGTRQGGWRGVILWTVVLGWHIKTDWRFFVREQRPRWNIY